MKKRTILIAAAAVSMVIAAAGCGKSTPDAAKATQAADTATADDVATSSEISEDNPEVKKMEATEKPKAPALSKMGTITMPDFSTIEVTTAPETVVDDEMVNQQIQYILPQHLMEVDGPAEEGDTVNIDYEGTINGEAFDGGSSKGYDLKLGSGKFIPGFEDQLVGAKAGDKVTVNVTFPADYQQADLAGKAAQFAVTVNTIKRVPTELTDEWVKSYDQTTAQTADEFRQQIKEMLEETFDNQYHSNIQQEALQQLVDQSDITLSDEMKQYGTDFLIYSNVQQAKQYGVGLADYINQYGMSLEDFKKEMESEGEQYAKQYFIIQKIAKDQGIEATDALIDKLADELTTMSGTTYNRIKLIEQYGGETVKNEVVRNAALEYLEGQVKVTVQDEAAAETDAAASATEAAAETEAAAASESSAAEN
ncbi:MAG: trigger factor, partial [Oribacterium sp.]|nr:trigger factor [Oribacterium sp.]